MITFSLLVLIGVGSIFTFQIPSKSIEIKNNSIISKSKDAHFAFNSKDLKTNLNNDKSILKEYLSDADTLSNNSIFTFYEDNKLKKVIEFTGYNSFQTYNYQDNSNKQEYLYSNIQFINEGLESFLDKTPLEIQNTIYLVDLEGNEFIPNENEALALFSLVSKTIVEARKYIIAKEIKSLSEKYEFTYSYMPSKTYFAFTSGKGENNDKLETFAYMYFLPAIKDKNKPYSLNLLEGRLPGEKIAEEFKRATTYDWESNGYNANLICKNIINIQIQNNCYDSLITEFVISENYAMKNNINIGDGININSLNGIVVGIGVATNVIYPKISKNHPIPYSKYMGVAWGFDTNEDDLRIAYEYKGSLTTTFLNVNALDSDAYIYGRFVDTISKDSYAERIASLENDLRQFSSSNEKIIIPRNSKDFPIKSQVDNLKILSETLSFIGYGLLGLMVFFILLLIPLSLRSIIKKSKSNLAAFSKRARTIFLMFLYFVFPFLGFAGSVVGGYFLGTISVKYILQILDPLIISKVDLFSFSNNTLMIYGLIAGAIIMSLLLLSLCFILSPKFKTSKKEKKAKWKLLEEATRVETMVETKKRKSLLISSIFTIISKAFLMIIIISITLPVVFTLLLTSQSFPNYKDNYSEGKNYKSAIYYNQPIWNSPFTRYTLAPKNNEDNTYASIDIENLRIGLEGGQTTNNLESVFTELLKSTWLKDSYIILSVLKEFDSLNFPTSQILGIDYSYPTIRDLTCSLLLGNKWETMDQNSQTITSCIKTMLTSKTPAFINEILKKKQNYPFSMGRVAIDKSLEELFTWADTSIESISNTPLNKKIESKIIGLTLNQKNVKLLDENNKDLFNDLFNIYLNDLEADASSVPIVLNKALAKKLNAKVGDILDTDIYRKELINVDTGLPVYAVIKDVNNNNVQTSGEAIGKYETYPDGNVYKYYYEEKAQGLQELVLGKDNGLVGFGWSMPKESKALFKAKKIVVKRTPNKQRLRVIGITNNYNLDENIIYTIRNHINKVLNYGDDWFSGVFSNKIKMPNDIFENQVCVSNLYGLYTQDSVLTEEFENPLSQCFSNAKFLGFDIPIIESFSNVINEALYIFMGFFGFLTFFLLLIIAIIASINTKNVFKINFRSRLQKRIIRGFTVVTYIFTFLITIGVTFGVTYFVTNEIAPDIITKYLFSVPINDNWWFYASIGGIAFFIIMFIYIILISTYRSKEQNKTKEV